MKRIAISRLACMLLVLLAAGCGTNSDSPTAPTVALSAPEPETSAGPRGTSACSIKSNYLWKRPE